jgi:hypothetical protein
VTRASRRKVVLTVHIAAALSLLGASTVLFVGGLHAATRDNPQEARDAHTLLRLLTFSVDIPLAIVALLAGLVFAFTSRWRIFGDRWLTAKLALYLATATIGVTLLGPSIDSMLDWTCTRHSLCGRCVVGVVPVVAMGLSGSQSAASVMSSSGRDLWVLLGFACARSLPRVGGRRSWATFGATLFADASFRVLVAVAVGKVGAGVGGGLDERPVA